MATATAPPQLATSTRISSLDGWRGIAILMVLADHFRVRILDGKPWPHSWVYVGQHGVTIFFALSGFLITANLIQHPNLKRFYVRRFFRLMPVAWVFLSAIAIFGVASRWSNVHASTLFASLAFVRNFTFSAPWLTQHFWSLSVEGQFYIAWPLILILAGTRRARWVAVGGAFAVATWRFLMWGFYNRYPLSFRTEVRADALLVGCLLALLFNEPAARAACARLFPYAYPACAVFLVYCITKFQVLMPLSENVAIAVLIGATYLRPECALSRALAWKPLAWIGLISYSLYVWQQPFFWIGAPKWCMIFAIPLAAASYYFIEKPCIRVSHRLKFDRNN